MRQHAVVTKRYTHEKLRQAREERGVSKTFLAKQLGYTHAAGYYNIEIGRVKASLEHAKIISSILGVPDDELFFA